MDAPPVEVQVKALAAASAALSQAEADAALARLRGAMPGTQFDSAKPSVMPGLIVLRLSNGKVAYTDKAGRYFIVGLIFDTQTGAALDKQMDGAS